MIDPKFQLAHAGGPEIDTEYVARQLGASKVVNLKSGDEVGPKPHPTCCKGVVGAGIWWEEKPSEKEVSPGWVMIKNVCIPIRSYWLANIKHCPFCGKKLPKKPMVKNEKKKNKTK